jgi:hypothetical protein
VYVIGRSTGVSNSTPRDDPKVERYIASLWGLSTIDLTDLEAGLKRFANRQQFC